MTRSYHAYGASAALFEAEDPRILIEGPANTGKTRGLLQFVDAEAWRCPGIRVLLLRKTLQSLRESVMVTLEDKVWWPGYPALNGTATRATRRRYVYPPCAHERLAPHPVSSVFICGGLEDPGWTFSMEYDIIAGFEAWEFTTDAIQSLYRANRNHVRCRYAPWNQVLAELVDFEWGDVRWLALHGGMPGGDPARVKDQNLRARLREDPRLLAAARAAHCHQQIVLDTNPRSEYHPLNHLAAPLGSDDQAAMRTHSPPSARVFRSAAHPFTRMLSRHEDNPACTEDDLAKLRALTGARYANLYLGLWQSEEGQIWESYDPSLHGLSAKVKREGEPAIVPPGGTPIVDMRPLYIEIEDGHPMSSVLGQRVPIDWTFGSIDFGYRNPGCFGLWFVDRARRLYRACELYFRERMDDWWADKIVELFLRFNMRAVVCDSEDPERIVKLNDRLTDVIKRRPGEPIARGVDKSVRKKGKGFVLTTIDLVRDLLDPAQSGGPKIFFLRDAQWFGRDEGLVAEFRPSSTEQEIPSYVFVKHEDGKPDKETPDPTCPNHGCDMVRYAALFAWPLTEQGDEWRRAPKHPVGSAGWRFGHDDVLETAERAQSEDELERNALLEGLLAERRRRGALPEPEGPADD